MYQIDDYLFRPEYSIEYIDAEFPVDETSGAVLYPCSGPSQPIDTHTDSPLVGAVVDQVMAACHEAVENAMHIALDVTDPLTVYTYAYRAWADAAVFENKIIRTFAHSVPGGDFWLTVSAIERFFHSVVFGALHLRRWTPDYHRHALADGLTRARESMQDVWFGDLGLETPDNG